MGGASSSLTRPLELTGVLWGPPTTGVTSSLSICSSVAGWGSLLWWAALWALLECSLGPLTPRLEADRLMGFRHGVACPRVKWQ